MKAIHCLYKRQCCNRLCTGQLISCKAMYVCKAINLNQKSCEEVGKICLSLVLVHVMFGEGGVVAGACQACTVRAGRSFVCQFLAHTYSWGGSGGYCAVHQHRYLVCLLIYLYTIV